VASGLCARTRRQGQAEPRRTVADTFDDFVPIQGRRLLALATPDVVAQGVTVEVTLSPPPHARRRLHTTGAVGAPWNTRDEWPFLPRYASEAISLSSERLFETKMARRQRGATVDDPPEGRMVQGVTVKVTLSPDARVLPGAGVLAPDSAVRASLSRAPATARAFETPSSGWPRTAISAPLPCHWAAIW